MFAKIFGSLGARPSRPPVLWALVRLVTCHLSLVTFLIGCKKSETPAEPKPPTNSQLSTLNSQLSTLNSALPLARLHWIGKKKLAADTNSAYLMTIWNLPESAKLEAQTLNKLAIAPWLATLKSDAGQNPVGPVPSPGGLATLSNRPPVITNYDEVVASHPSAKLLRPLLDDLLQEEWHIEVKSAESRVQSGGTNSPTGTPALPAEFTLAIRLDDKQDTLWRSNLPKVYKSFPTNSALFTPHSALSFSRSSPWTIVTITGSADVSSANPVELLRRLGTVAVSTNTQPSTLNPQLSSGWLDGMLDLPKLAAALGGHLSSDWPQVTMTLNGDGQNVRTRAELEFSSPLQLEIEPWNIPTNLIHDPLIGFMAIRGIRPWLEKWKALTDLQLGPLPNQAFFWAQAGLPTYHFAAVPSGAVSEQMEKLSELFLRDVNPVVASNKLGIFERTEGSRGLHWRGISWFVPFLDYVDAEGRGFIIAGFNPSRYTTDPIPTNLLVQVYGSTNLLAYDWEFTQNCLQGLTQTAQLLRNVLGRARLTGTAAMGWLVAVFPKLRNSGSAVKWDSASRLSFSRTSTIGFTAAELQLLMDWLESPEFPRGSHTELARPSRPLALLRPQQPKPMDGQPNLENTNAAPTSKP